LNEKLPDSLVDPDSKYNIVRYDRHNFEVNIGAAGVCALISKQFKYAEVNISREYPTLEMCCFDILCGNDQCRVFNVYHRLSKGPEGRKYMCELIACLNKYTQTKWPIIITGDINCGNIDRSNLTAPEDSIEDAFLNFCVTNIFMQLVSEPTRGNNIYMIYFLSH